MSKTSVSRISKRSSLVVGAMAAFCCLSVVAGCSVKEAGNPQAGTSASNSTSNSDSTISANETSLSGTITIDGSSTVFPISQAVAEEFQKIHKDVKVVVGTSGTGGGFKKFIAGESDINDASRPIKKSEKESCKKNGVEYIELKVAIDGLSVVVNSKNDWCKCLSVAQLKKIWEPNSKVKKWSEIDPDFPDEEFKLYGPDTDSGTFDYFTEAICGEGGASRSDYTPSADDNVLVRGVSGDKYSLGYFGYAYYIENKDKLNVIGISASGDESDCVKPTDKSIEAGKYVPLSRPLFIYVNKTAIERPEVVVFLEYYFEQGQTLVGEVGYVKISETELSKTRQALKMDPDASTDATTAETE